MVLQAQLRPADDINHAASGAQPSPFHSRTSKLNINQSWAVWNGYASATFYADSHLEYFSTRNTCGVFDITPMKKYRFKGSDAEAMLNRMVTRDVSAQAVNTVAYNIWCTDLGRLIDDGTLFRLADDEFLMCCTSPCMDWFMLSATGFENLEITDESADIAGLALQGPTSCAALKSMGFSGVENARPFEIVHFPYRSKEIMISRTGFTGDLGYELWVNPELAEALWDDLFEAGSLLGIQPLGEESLDIARMEAGFLTPEVDFQGALHTVNLRYDHSPLELGLGWMLNFKKAHFNGRSTLLAQKESGDHRRLFKLDVEGLKPAESSILYNSSDLSQAIGYVTSATWSPVVKANIAYGLVEAKYADGPIFAEVYYQRELRWIQKICECTRMTKPFWAPARAKATPPADF